MKSSIIFTIALLTLSVGTIQAQSTSTIQETEQSIKQDGKYALLVMKAQHLKAAIKTGISFKGKSEAIDFQIITCGKLVEEIAQDAELQKLIKEAVNKYKMRIVVCGLSIEQFSVDKSKLPEELSITENGLTYLFGLQENGYKTIAL